MFEGPPTGEDLSRFEESFLSRFDDFSEEELNSDASQLQLRAIYTYIFVCVYV